MEDDLEQSLDAFSEFVPVQGMGQSLVATSEKVYFQNASSINRHQLQEALKTQQANSQIKEIPPEQESQNQFLEVGKWKKAKESNLHKDMQTVKDQVEQIITQTRWKRKDQPNKVEETVADETWVPKGSREEEEEEIEDQTQQEEGEGDQEEDDEEQQQEQQEEQSQEQEQQEEQEQNQEQQDQSEQQEQQQEEGQQEEQGEQEGRKQPQKQLRMALSHSNKSSAKSQASRDTSQVSMDDKTDTHSEMKKTEYLPTSKWTKKAPQNVDPWKRKEAILLRIAKMLEQSSSL